MSRLPHEIIRRILDLVDIDILPFFKTVYPRAVFETHQNILQQLLLRQKESVKITQDDQIKFKNASVSDFSKYICPSKILYCYFVRSLQSYKTLEICDNTPEELIDKIDAVSRTFDDQIFPTSRKFIGDKIIWDNPIFTADSFDWCKEDFAINLNPIKRRRLLSQNDDRLYSQRDKFDFLCKKKSKKTERETLEFNELCKVMHTYLKLLDSCHEAEENYIIQLIEEKKAVFVVQNDVQIVGIFNDKLMAQEVEQSMDGWTTIHVLNELECTYPVYQIYNTWN